MGRARGAASGGEWRRGRTARCAAGSLRALAALVCQRRSKPGVPWGPHKRCAACLSSATHHVHGAERAQVWHAHRRLHLPQRHVEHRELVAHGARHAGWLQAAGRRGGPGILDLTSGGGTATAGGGALRPVEAGARRSGRCGCAAQKPALQLPGPGAKALSAAAGTRRGRSQTRAAAPAGSRGDADVLWAAREARQRRLRPGSSRPGGVFWAAAAVLHDGAGDAA